MAEPETNRAASSETGGVFGETIGFFTSVKTTIAVLFLLAAASVIGTLIPQEAGLAELKATSSPFLYRLIILLDLHQLYRSWWFLLLLVLLSINLLACLLKKARNIPADWKGKDSQVSFRMNMEDGRPPSEVKKLLAEQLNPFLGGKPKESSSREAISLTWVKHRVHLLGFPLIHTAIIVILLGGLTGIVYGYRGYLSIKEGEEADRFVIKSGGTGTLPFTVAVDEFTLTRYPTGEPKEYRSNVRLLEDGREVHKGPIVVNSPMTYRSISLYQSDYRAVGVKWVKLALSGPDGVVEEFLIRPFQTVPLPGTSEQIRLHSLDPGSSTRGQGVEMTATGPDGESRRVEVFKNDPNPTDVGGRKLGFLGYQTLYATGLQVGYDPGTPLVWWGSGLLVAGFLLTLFTNHRRLAVEIKKEKGRTTVQISGRSRRLRQEFRQAVQEKVRLALGESGKGPRTGQGL
ncbi:MAG: cytochrome c biogenesis protein ResB [Thermodesulfobacteriota bacterium]